MTTLYSKTGNVELNSNKIRIDGMIYVPNGKIIINADTFELSGMIIAKDISIMVSDSYIRNTDKILKRYNVLKNINLDLIQDVNDVYGSYYANEFDYEELAKSIIVSNVDSIKAKDFGKIELGDRIELYDEMDKLKSYGYNYTFGEQYGAVIMSAHSFGFLADKIIPDTVLCDCVDKIYYFANGEVYYRKSDEIYDNHNQLLSTEKFNGMKSYLIGCRLNITYEQLKSINEENELIIRQMGTKDKAFVLSKHYDGTDEGAYGGQGISNVIKYLKDRYNCKSPKLVAENILSSMNKQTMKEISGKNANNCSLVAISKVIYYWRTNRKTKIPNDIKTIYKDVEKIAKKNGYTDKGGTDFWKISAIMEETLDKYGYKNSDCDGVYIWDFDNTIKKEIVARRPIVFNIARGYYGNHSVTLAGYSIYKVNGDNYEMLCISDGWTSSFRYVDYEAFAFDLVVNGFGSFNQTIVK